MPGWQRSHQLVRDLPPNWESEIRPRILARDFHRCQWVRVDTGKRCLAPNSHDVDHIINRDSGGTDEDSNLQTLCAFHHNRKSGHEGGKASGRARAARAKSIEKPKHPGLIDPPGEPAPF